MAPFSLPANDLRAVWGSAANDVWFVGDRETLLHWDGTTIQDLSDRIPGRQGSSLTALWGQSAKGQTTLWAVGQSGTVITIVQPGAGAPTLTRQTGLATANLTGIWNAAAPDSPLPDLWLAAGNALLRWDTASPPVPVVPGSDASQSLRAVFGLGPSDIWAVGDKGLALHFQAGAWQKVDLGTDKDLHAVWGDSRGVWVAGPDLLMRRYANGTWMTDNRPSLRNRFALWSSGGDNLWVIGGGMESIPRSP